MLCRLNLKVLIIYLLILHVEKNKNIYNIKKILSDAIQQLKKKTTIPRYTPRQIYNIQLNRYYIIILIVIKYKKKEMATLAIQSNDSLTTENCFMDLPTDEEKNN